MASNRVCYWCGYGVISNLKKVVVKKTGRLVGYYHPDCLKQKFATMNDWRERGFEVEL